MSNTLPLKKKYRSTICLNSIREELSITLGGRSFLKSITRLVKKNCLNLVFANFLIILQRCPLVGFKLFLNKLSKSNSMEYFQKRWAWSFVSLVHVHLHLSKTSINCVMYWGTYKIHIHTIIYNNGNQNRCLKSRYRYHGYEYSVYWNQCSRTPYTQMCSSLTLGHGLFKTDE